MKGMKRYLCWAGGPDCGGDVFSETPYMAASEFMRSSLEKARVTAKSSFIRSVEVLVTDIETKEDYKYQVMVDFGKREALVAG